MYNLLAHKTPKVIKLIVMSGHHFCFWTPYYHVDGAIRYIFNPIQRDLEVKLPEIRNSNDLRNEVFNTVGSMIIFFVLRYAWNGVLMKHKDMIERDGSWCYRVSEDAGEDQGCWRGCRGR